MMMKIKNLPVRYLIVLLTFICTSVCYIERVGFSIAYTVAADAAGVKQSTKGTILSTFYYGYACSQVPGGYFAQKIGGFIFPSIHTVLAQWVPLHERSRSVSLTTSGMYLGAALGMLFLPSLVKYKGPQSVFIAEAFLGFVWSFIWFRYSSDPKSSASGAGESILPVNKKVDGRVSVGIEKSGVEKNGGKKSGIGIPWMKIMTSFPVWAIVVNNFTFHYALYVLMNWLPTYFELGLKLSLHEMGSSKMLPYLNMFVFSNIGGVVADYLITRRIMSVTRTRKFLNTIGFLVASFALIVIPSFRTSGGAVFCSSVALGFLALGRAGFAVNHMDIAPRYAGIVMGVSNTAGTLAGIVGVDLTGKLLEAAKSSDLDLSSPESWRMGVEQSKLEPNWICKHGVQGISRLLIA
ncbi:putative anion transporter 5 [Trifolium repens]|nr:putative anion transporter 5 [Trifolium repens]